LYAISAVICRSAVLEPSVWFGLLLWQEHKDKTRKANDMNMIFFIGKKTYRDFYFLLFH